MMWPVRGTIICGLLALVLLVGGLGGWAATAPLAAAVTLSGQVEVDPRHQIVQHAEGGLVTALLVAEGDRVSAGQVLLRLDTTQLRADLAATEAQYHEILARRARLEAERDGAAEARFDPTLRSRAPDLVAGQAALFAARRESHLRQQAQMERRLNQIARQIEAIGTQLVALDIQADLTSQERRTQDQLLDAGLARAPQVLALRRAEAAQQGELGRLRAARAEAEERAAETELALLRLTDLHREEALTQLREIGYREIELSAQRDALQDRIDRAELRAPMTGTAWALQAAGAGAVLRPAEPALVIVPEGQPLIVRARLPAGEAGRIRPGQPARMHKAAHGGRDEPPILGNVLRISPDAMSDEVTQGRYFQLVIGLPETETLRPGMPVDVFLQTDSRTALAYLLHPVSRYLDRALREG
ncbi:HlyD family type I secretion periplasmic adaptor subunit [Halodurantibacterium flavum]|uniref:Membrane fusion protein (MFP) family protein n=1 Tax=Halodurantibacterium flavum TaxID=1382802 RepID=A0ABW4S748_9RHOB